MKETVKTPSKWSEGTPRIVKKTRLKHRRNFLPTLLLSTLFWIGWGCLVYFLPPENTLLIFAFYILLSIAVFLTFALIFANSRRGLLIATALIGFLLLRYYHLGNPLNISLLLVILICLELYYR